MNIVNPFGGKIFFKPETASTMEDAKLHLSHGAIFLTDKQTEGKCRNPQETWQSTNKDITFTLSLHKSKTPMHAPLSLLIGLAIARFFQQLPLSPVTIKWPNDILIQEKKISGILTQEYEGFYLVGIGINIEKKDHINILFKKQIFPAVGLEEIFPNLTHTKTEIIDNLLQELHQTLTIIQWQDAFNKLLYKPNHPITYQVGDKYIEGKILSVNKDGALLVKTLEGTITPLYAGEVVRR
ncbi:biotin--[acetyl-CoA-carboxylase] ligase [Entomospira culicis]|uniref:biotin--[biotin carboxyl-carrier protein] ligase n=1 Tax=Entomospira culicis TaxID=2719989 RepID=A0A968GFS2_9SPIO|nr:biotin--[acetyl-CoA-carboxylase] ligase [Entomospira culicis]NIZ19603.1 biotin--[acetyl-CoA-carboxylase] ligase [Entomospira culicis]NIZ69492.1 biotin--[acetyl-CoA-carboxylase] ligase [Entomospira culicis]WDI36607.1 biotin--[acetyl-CoA-carboxylase] ligase [Entomospira culicis]WDI38235.1 biotin--[acetyl-CoA-carboxylase] ligase [Entomospira culicis]